MGKSSELLYRFGSIAGIMTASREALLSALGGDDSVVDALLAVRQLASAGWREMLAGEAVNASDARLRQYLLSKLHNPREERLHAIFLAADNRFIRDEIVGVGTRGALRVRMRSLVQRALELEASKLILAHNHPSGSLMPSSEDRRATGEFETIVRALEIELIDHFIIASGKVYSMRYGKEV